MKVSNSKIDTFNMCRRKYALQYVCQCKPVKRGKMLLAGQAGHDYLAMQSGRLSTFAGELTLEEQIAVALAEKYTELHSEALVGQAEKLIETELDDVVLVTKPDLVHNQSFVEYKFTARPPLAPLSLSQQLGLYFLSTGAEKCHLVTFRFPSLKQGTHETDESFLKRVRTDIVARADYYILRDTYYRGEFNVLFWQEYAECIASDIVHAEKHSCFPPSVKACTAYSTRCPYYNICATTNLNLFELPDTAVLVAEAEGDLNGV